MRFVLVKVALDDGQKERLAWAIELGFAQYRATCGERNIDAFLWADSVDSAKSQVREWFPKATFSDETDPPHNEHEWTRFYYLEGVRLARETPCR